MAVKLNSTGGGSVTLDSPSTASNYTVTLPSAAGTLATTTGTGSVFTNPTINGFTGDTTAVTIGTTQFVKDASGNIGIGTASPSTYGKFVVSGGSTAIDPQLTIESTAFNASQGCALNFARAGFTQPIQARISTTDNGASASNLVFSTKVDGTAGALTPRMYLNSTGALIFAGGNTAASGIGIAFPATQSASSDPNTLDDYKEATWTPTLSGITFVGADSSTYSYIKIGRVLCVSINLAAATSVTIASNATITLPFTVTGAASGRFGSANSGIFGDFVVYGTSIVLKSGAVASASYIVSFTCFV